MICRIPGKRLSHFSRGELFLIVSVAASDQTAFRGSTKSLRLFRSSVALWVASLDGETVLSRCKSGGVLASLIFSIADIFEDPQYRARGNIKMMPSRGGEIAVPEVVPRLSGTPGNIDWLGEGRGA